MQFISNSFVLFVIQFVANILNSLKKNIFVYIRSDRLKRQPIYSRLLEGRCADE